MEYLSCHEKLIDPSRTAKYSRIAQFSVAKKPLKDVAIVIVESRDNHLCHIYQKQDPC